MAEGWAKVCKFAHGQPTSPTSQFGYAGQNIYAKSIYPTKINYTDITFKWFGEKKDYSYESTKCTVGKMCGHYTQVHTRLYDFSKDHSLDHYNLFIILKRSLIECFKYKSLRHI